MSFALAALADGMTAYLREQAGLGVVAAAGVSVVFGWKAREQILNQGVGGANRIVIIPGDPDSGAAGTIERGHQTSSNPRVLANWHKLATMSVWGVDTSSAAALQDEGKQTAATENLVELAVQALHNALDPLTEEPLGVGNIHWLPAKWSRTTTNFYFGRELMMPFIQKGPLYDFTYATTNTAIAKINREPVTP